MCIRDRTNADLKYKAYIAPFDRTTLKIKSDPVWSSDQKTISFSEFGDYTALTTTVTGATITPGETYIIYLSAHDQGNTETQRYRWGVINEKDTDVYNVYWMNTDDPTSTDNSWTRFDFTNRFYDFAYLLSCLLYTSPSPRDLSTSRMPSSA